MNMQVKGLGSCHDAESLLCLSDTPSSDATPEAKAVASRVEYTAQRATDAQNSSRH